MKGDITLLEYFFTKINNLKNKVQKPQVTIINYI